MYPCVVRIFRMSKSAKLSHGPEHGALLLCEFQAQDINISLELERELARASLGPPSSSSPLKGPRLGVLWGTDPGEAGRSLGVSNTWCTPEVAAGP